VLEDYEFFLRLSKHYLFKYINEPLVSIYTQPDSITFRWSERADAYQLLLRKYFEDIRQDKKLLALHYFRLGDQLCYAGRLREGREYFIKGFKENPRDLKMPFALFVSFSGKHGYTFVANGYRRVMRPF
jgi:hypothetical protein